jgi:hypothetical protein
MDACSSQEDVNAAFAQWIGSFNYTGGCGTTASDLSGYVAPDACGGMVVVNYSANDNCGQSDDCTASFTVTYAPELSITCPDADQLPCSAEAPTPTIDDVVISENCGIADYSIDLISMEESGCSRVYTYAITVTDVCGHTDACQWVRTVECPCGDVYCTKTQGFFGNYGGMYCDSVSTIDLLDDLLGQGPLVLGSLGRSFTVDTDEADCVITALPGGGPSNMIGMGNFGFNGNCLPTGGIPIFSGGRWKNELAAQTLTLGLNMRIAEGAVGGELGSFVLEAPCFITAASSGCGDADAYLVPETEEVHCIPQSVFDYFDSNPTVLDLYNLANSALGGANTGVNRGHITAAISAINEGFDECRFLMGYSANPGIAAARSIEVNANEPVSFQLSPNPTRDIVRMKFSSLVESPLQAELIDEYGRVVMKTQVTSGDVSLDVSQLAAGVYVMHVYDENGTSVRQRLMVTK